MRTLLYVLGQNAGWLACVLGAARDRHWLGPLVVAGLVVLHLTTRSRRSVRRILSLAGVAVLFGFCFDSLLMLGGVYEPVRWVVPPPWATVWLLALWINFALIADVPLRWLQEHLIVAAVCGAIFGPAAYLAGQRLGAIRIGTPALFHLGILVIAWALGLAAFMLMARRLPGVESQPAVRQEPWAGITRCVSRKDSGSRTIRNRGEIPIAPHRP